MSGSDLVRRVCVIGAGTAGICAAKTAREYGLEVTVYEQADRIGGNWNYTDRVGPDEYGLNYGFMYQDVITNVPKEVMGYIDFDVAVKDRSYLSTDEVSDFLNQYVDHFGVEKDIKFRHEVIRVRPLKDDRWEVIVKDVLNDQYATELFDFVMVCTGHHWDPRFPNFKGETLFKGSLKHSNEFRRKEDYSGQRVCIIGSGSSSVDIAVLLGDVASEVIYSQHYPYAEDTVFPDNLRLVVDTQELTETGVRLKDGTEHSVDAIIYCTGFKFTFPFLTTDSGITAEDNYVRPLFKHLISINHPTMAFIGLNYHVMVQLLMDLQARFCLKFWSTNRPFPTKAEMLQDCERDLEIRLAKGWKRSHAHRIWDLHEDYNKQLAELADIPNIPPVYLKIYFDAMGCLRKNYTTYRTDNYQILDDENYVKFVGGGKK